MLIWTLAKKYLALPKKYVHDNSYISNQSLISKISIQIVLSVCLKIMNL